MKHIKLFEAFVNEAGETVRGHQFKMKQNINFDAFQSDVEDLINDVENMLGKALGQSDVHALLQELWYSICRQTRRQDKGFYLEQRLGKFTSGYLKPLQRSKKAFDGTKAGDFIYDRAMSISKHVGKDAKCIGMAMCFSDVLGQYGLSEEECIKFVQMVGHLNYSTIYINEEAINERLITKPQQMADEFDSVVANLENEYGTEVNSGDAAFMMQWMWERMCMSTPALATLIRDQFNKRRIPTRGNFKAGRGATRNDLADAATALGGRALFFKNSKGAKSLPVTFEMMRLIASNWDIGTPADWDAIEKLAYKNLR